MGQPTTDRRDQGFTLIEVTVALAVIGAVMAALSTFFVASLRFGHQQGRVQAAGRLSGDAMEIAAGLGGPALLRGRAACGSCADPAVAGAASTLTGMQRWDAAGTGAAAVPTPNQPELILLDGITYRRYWFVGRCWQPLNGGTCGADSALPASYARLVVAVTWRGNGCPNGLCTRTASALFSANPGEPVFLQ